VQRTTGRTPEEITAHEAALFDALISVEEYPALRQAVDAGVFLSATDPFTFGFERVLDGVAAYLAVVGADGNRAARPDWVVLADADIAGDKRYREAQKAVREAEKSLRDALKLERIAARDARERLAKHSGG
jgi:hypothetical protein